MQNVTPEPYEFAFVDDAVALYTFSTKVGALYAVRFKPTPYLFENSPEIANQVYELVIELVRPSTHRAGADVAVSITIALICRDFFQHHERILLYICETADFKHLARVRKFDGWFRQFNDHQYLKLDTQFPDTNGLSYHISLIFKWGHPYRHEIMDAFEALSEQYGSDK